MNCDKCNGIGTIVHEFKGGDTRNGIIVEGPGYTTELCECRKNLPRRHGRAAWFAYDDSVIVEEGLGVMLRAGVRFRPELPVSEDNYPLFRTLDNAHFCCSIEIRIDGDPLSPDEMRNLADFLTRMAAKAEEINVPVPDEVAHA